MDLTSGRPYWPIKSGLPFTYPPLKDDITCEVAIIGGGITGALVAYHLVSAGVDTVLLDRRDIGFGSTSASTGLVSYENDVPLHQLVRKVGEENAVRSYRLSLEAVRKIGDLAAKLEEGCGFERKESLYVASQRSHEPRLRAEFELRRRHGFEVEWWPKSRLARQTSLPQSAAMLSKEAAQVDPYRLTNGLLAIARRKGLRAFDRTAVTSRHFGARHSELATSRGVRVRAKKIVVATGYEALSTLKATPTALHSTYALITEPLTGFVGWPERRLIWETARPYFYLRATEDGRAIIGGYDEPFRDPLKRDRLLSKKTELLARRFAQLFPRIEFEVAYAWTGTFAETPDGLPYIGEHADCPRTYFALGYGGNGITYSFIAAEIIRDLYLGRANADAPLFRFGR